MFANNELLSCAETPPSGALVESVLLDSPDGAALVRRTLSYLLCAAAQAGPDARALAVRPSVHDCDCWAFADGARPSPDELLALDAALRALIAVAIPITVDFLSVHTAAALFRARGQDGLARLLALRGCASVKVNVCGAYTDVFREPLLPHTGMVPPDFCLVPYHDGFALVAGTAKKNLFAEPAGGLVRLHDQYKMWARVCGVDSAESLNALAAGGSTAVRDFIRINEIYADKNFADAARHIYERRDETRIVLLAGPSSSGKTTSAKRLCLHLRVLGLLPISVSLDDYYLPRDKVPRDEDGNLDFECLESLDVPYLNEQLLALLAGKEVTLPSFNFRNGVRSQGRTIQLGRRAILVVEGIHALNDRLTPDIPRHTKYKLYVSALTQIKIDEHHRVSSCDNRLLRRLVRDYRYRAMSAHATLEMWPRVRRGEMRYIFPFQDTADFILNSALEYEIGVLRLFAEPVLRSASVEERTHAEAARLLAVLENFTAIPPDYIPGTSVLREFIGDSDFSY